MYILECFNHVYKKETFVLNNILHCVGFEIKSFGIKTGMASLEACYVIWIYKDMAVVMSHQTQGPGAGDVREMEIMDVGDKLNPKVGYKVSGYCP